MDWNTFLSYLLPYKELVQVFIMLLLLFDAIIVIRAVMRKGRKVVKEKVRIDKENLKNINVKQLKQSMHGRLIRTVVSPDGIDPNTLGYMTVMDGGHEKLVRTFTIVGKPKRSVFAKTFAGLFNFGNCTSSVFIIPIAEEEMSRKLNDNITILSSEYSQASGDPNRRRKLSAQAAEENSWAEEIENGENRFFEVGFLFSLYADTLQELNKMSDSFYAEALAKNIIVSNCYGLQAEAYALNGPFNGHVKVVSGIVKQSPVNYVTMDKYSVSTLFNYLQSSFNHNSGVPLGRNMITGDVEVFDLFDPGHDSMGLIIAGKPGSGKSAVIKIMSARQSLFGWHFISIDSQVRKGTSEGEYAALAIAAGGINFQIRNDASECLNPFDISESVRSVKVSDNRMKEIRTVDLSGKIVTLTNTICSMILASANRTFDFIHEQICVRRIVTDTALQTYTEFGIYDNDVDSLYESIESRQGITTGVRRKPLPTLCDFYKNVLINNRNNMDQNLKSAYTLIIYALKDRIKELYYIKETSRFLSRAEYESLTMSQNGSLVTEIEAIKGTRAYYDGQSTVPIDRDCPHVNIDISTLPEDEKRLARQIAMAWMTENFIKKNSEGLDSRNKLVVIIDEALESFKDEYARDTIDITVREARKRNVGIILATQTLKEFENYPETQSILKLAQCKFIFKQDYQDRNYLIESIGLTPMQADMIVGSLGGSDRNSEEEEQRHKGEMCIIDGSKVSFCKVDYLKETEALIVDTDAAGVEKLFKAMAAAK